MFYRHESVILFKCNIFRINLSRSIPYLCTCQIVCNLYPHDTPKPHFYSILTDRNIFLDQILKILIIQSLRITGQHTYSFYNHCIPCIQVPILQVAKMALQM